MNLVCEVEATFFVFPQGQDGPPGDKGDDGEPGQTVSMGSDDLLVGASLHSQVFMRSPNLLTVGTAQGPQGFGEGRDPRVHVHLSRGLHKAPRTPLQSASDLTLNVSQS